jgi:hypothetical protein
MKKRYVQPQVKVVTTLSPDTLLTDFAGQSKVTVGPGGDVDFGSSKKYDTGTGDEDNYNPWDTSWE